MKRVLCWCTFCFLLGILSANFNETFLRLLLPALFLGGLLSFFKRGSGKAAAVFFAVFFVLLGIFLSVFYRKEETRVTRELLAWESTVCRVTNVRDRRLTAEVAASSFNTFYLYIELPENAEIPECGSVLSVSGSFSVPEEPDNPGQFNYAEYLLQQGILGEIQADTVSVIKKANVFRRLLGKCRTYIYEAFREVLPEEEAGYLTAFFLSDRSGVDSELLLGYRKLGISYILAISGMHISVLTGIFGLFLSRRFRRPTVKLISIFLLLFFGSLCGFSVSVVRSLGIYIISAAGDFRNRRNDPLTGLCFVMLLVLSRRPVMLFNESFLLSYGATFVFFAVLPAVNRILVPGAELSCGVSSGASGSVRNPILVPGAELSCGISSGTSGSFGKGTFPDIVLPGKKRRTKPDRLPHPVRNLFILQLLLLPVILSFQYYFSPYSVLLNLLLVPLLPLIFVYGIGILVFLKPAPVLSELMSFGFRVFYALMEKTVRFTLKLPFSKIVTGKPKLFGILLFYLLAFLLILRCFRSGFRNVRMLPFSLLIVLLFSPHTGTELRNLSVGQGDCTVVLSGTHALLIDCGSTSRQNVGSNILLPYLYRNGISSVDYVILSHADLDHYSGISEICGEIPVHCFLATEMPEDEAMLQSLSECMEIPEEGESFTWCSFTVRILWPGSGENESANNRSLVLLLKKGAFTGLFTGDIDADVFTELASYIRSKISYLKVPHHGSRYSSSPAALSVLLPQYSVISAGKGNVYGHPHVETLEAFSELGLTVIRTDQTGSAGFEITEEGDIRLH